MPIYEYYSPDTNRIYSFFAKTLAQGRVIPKCPDNPKARMVKLISGFAIGGRHKSEPAADATVPATDAAEDARMEAAMKEMEGAMSSLDENDPRALARMMRRMSELAGEKLDEPMEEAIRKLEEGADPDALEEEMSGLFGDDGEPGTPGPDGPADAKKPDAKEARAKFKVRRPPPTRDPKLYDYE